MNLLDSASSARGCDGRCPTCAAGTAPRDAGLLQGAALVWRSAVVFLLPLAGLAAGAALAGGTGPRAVGGAALGGAVAVVAARLLTRRGLRGRTPAEADEPDDSE